MHRGNSDVFVGPVTTVTTTNGKLTKQWDLLDMDITNLQLDMDRYGTCTKPCLAAWIKTELQILKQSAWLSMGNAETGFGKDAIS